MAQQLIVEGKDAVVLSEILMKRKVTSPKGYADRNKYIKEFVKQTGSESLVNDAIQNSLERADITNLGVIVDANEVGAISRFNRIKAKVEATLLIQFPKEKTLTKEGFYWQALPNLRIGIWIMPNNMDNGYLEHFLLNLIEEKDKTLDFARAKTAELMKMDFCNFSSNKRHKALLHTYLAWQKNPGLPMGTAAKAGYLNTSAPTVDNFENWWKNVFELEGQIYRK